MMTKPRKKSRKIGTLNEKSLHAALKSWYAKPSDRLEVWVAGYLIDIVRSDSQHGNDILIEIQTGNFSSIKQKLLALTADYAVCLIYPIAREKWLLKLAKGDADLAKAKRRKSPKRGTFFHVFDELVSFPHLLANPNFALEVLLTQEEEVRRYVGKRKAWRRRGWATEERRLVDVVEQRRFETPADIATLLPSTLDEPFTTADLAAAIDQPRRVAQRMAYCLRKMDVITSVGKRSHAILYVRHPQ
jgi:hypothetical protein